MNILQEVVDSFNLELSTSINQISTWYVDNSQNLNLVLDLMFLQVDAEEFNNHQILPDLWNPSNHTSLSVYIIIEEEIIQDRKQTIIKNSEEEK